LAEIWNVPGNQQAALREQVRRAVRERAGYGIRTHVHESMVSFVCEPIYAQHEAEYMREAAEAMNSLFSEDSPAPGQRPTRLSWDTWAVD
jgi:hypothetical protein